MAPTSFSVMVLLGVLSTVFAQKFYVIAPSTFRLNSDETVAIVVEDRPAFFHVFIQDYPGKIKNISRATFAVHPGHPELINFRLDPANFPPIFFSGPDSQKLVSLTAYADDFFKEILIPINTQSGYVFIQTDKPIYTPDQRVNMRIIPLTEEVSPSDQVFKLQIKNSRGIIVDEAEFNNATQKVRKTFVTHIYKFPSYPILGEWSATVRYGHGLLQNSTVHFQLQEYVLPTFTVELQAQDVILPSTETIHIRVTAKYVYGKKVEGVVTFRVGVKGEAPNTTFFSVYGPKKLIGGFFDLTFRTDDFKQHKNIGWFPEIRGSRLFVEATVLDAATSKQETATDDRGRFAESPFLISFKRCLQDFKPGLVSVFEADINLIDGRPAQNVTTQIKANADGKPLHIVHDLAVSDLNGKVTFEIQPEIHHSIVSITLETKDPRYNGSQAVGNFVQNKFISGNSQAYIALARSTPLRLQPTDKFSKLVHFEPAGIQPIYYLVVAKGKILAVNKLPPGKFKTQQVEFFITHDMVPNFRVLVFAHYRDELLADSLKIEVARECDPNAQVSVIPDYDIKEPGHDGKIVIKGTKGARVGLLGVDEAVYALSKKDLLTKAKVFDKLASHDLGCGPGGGLTINDVFGNAGITIGTKNYTSSLSHTCERIKRRKREAALDIVSTYVEGLEKQCCSLGIQRDKFDRNCEERMNVVVRQLQGEHENCSRAFLECCIYAKEHGITGMKLKSTGRELGRSGQGQDDELDFIQMEDEDQFEKDGLVRTDFKETWIFQDVLIGSDNKEVVQATLPDSITTWVIQAVSVSDKHGICVAEPQKLVTFKKIFLHLNLPYSVVRNEQVEIQATVFNYGSRRISAVIYMYGAENLCSGTQPGKKSERKQLIIDAHSAKTATFPVIPLRAEDFPIKVVVISSQGGDMIERKLHVVPEGVTKEIDIPIKLDPSNQQRRTQRHTDNSEYYEDTIDPSQNIQLTTVKLSVPEGFVPGTATCSIAAIGNLLGPVVETTIQNPDGLLRIPQGCGEQTTSKLAPTMYTMRYLKVTGKLTAEHEQKGYDYMRLGYGNILKFRRDDGSFSAYPGYPATTWMTAFVIKVLCQANEMIHIDENVLCSGVRWLVNNQQEDGSYLMEDSVYRPYLMGGVQGKIPMTAFTLITLGECHCDVENLQLAKLRALYFLGSHLQEVEDPLPAAIVAYALALGDDGLKDVANDRLIQMAKTDEGTNTMFWEAPNSAQDIETAGYALLTQLLLNDMDKSRSIVNWLNTKQSQSGCYKSTHDTVVALQSLTEYAIRAQQPSINLVTNISSSNDRNFHEVLTFNDDNALVLQNVKVNKIGGTLFINTAGHGVGSLAVKLRYNMIVPPEQRSRFDVTLNVTEAKDENTETVPPVNLRNNILDSLPEPIRGVAQALNEEKEIPDISPRNRSPPSASNFSLASIPPEQNSDEEEEIPDISPRNRSPPSASNFSLASIPPEQNSDRVRVKQQNKAENSKTKYKISICVRYLGNQDAEMSIVDVGVFSGFEPIVEDLKQLENDPDHLIQMHEISSSGVVFYLSKVPTEEEYCFSFHVIREYMIGNTQMSVVKVYDYYNPDEVTTKFYSPASDSPILRTICDGGICECAEGGCPPRTPFLETGGMDPKQRRTRLREIACEDFDYVWKGKLNGSVKKEGGFLNISFTVVEVVKEGIEKREFLEGESRTLLSRDNCAPLYPGVTYLLMGKDGQKYKNVEGHTWYRYFLDKTSEVYIWTSTKDAKDSKLQRVLNTVIEKITEEGCPN